MKKLITIITTCMIVYQATYLGAQNKPRKIEGEKTEKKADKNNFVFYKQGDLNVVFNKNNSLMIYESSFDTKTKETNLDNIIRVSGRPKVDSLFYKIIIPFYRDYKSNSTYELEEFEIYLHAKPDGKVCELVFRYNTDVNITLNTIEKLEREILSLNLELIFIGDKYFFTDVLWVYYPVRYSVSRMKKYLKEKSK
jgi:hypothetical protein